jgi:hypothetical protein
VTLRAPEVTCVGNVTGHALRTKDAIADDLANNISHGVRSNDATTVLKELGCNLFLEMPLDMPVAIWQREPFPVFMRFSIVENRR